MTSQCNTLIAMRLRNPDDQRFIAKTSDMVSAADLEELPGLSTGEALICGRSIPAPLLVRVGTKALVHGGESPEVLNVWGRFTEPWHLRFRHTSLRAVRLCFFAYVLAGYSFMAALCKASPSSAAVPTLCQAARVWSSYSGSMYEQRAKSKPPSQSIVIVTLISES